jgi:hypothetical protein
MASGQPKRLPGTRKWEHLLPVSRLAIRNLVVIAFFFREDMQGDFLASRRIKRAHCYPDPLMFIPVDGVKEKRGPAGGAKAASNLIRRVVPRDVIFTVHLKDFPGNLDIGEKMTGPFPALHAVTDFDRADRAGDLKGNGTAET